jgi:hypothetical protein
MWNKGPMTRTRRLAVAVALAGSLLWGCPGSTTLDASRYQTSCQVASDCVTVFVGDVCSTCTCHNTAISRSSQEAYNGDLGGIIFWCTPGLLDTCGACAQVTAVCDAGQCGLAPR